MKTPNTLYVFDKDDTLTPSSQEIQDHHAMILSKFITNNITTLLTARNMDCCKEHIIDPLLRNNPGTPIENMYFACSNGAEIYRFKNEKSLKISTSEHASQLQDGSSFNLEELCQKAIEIVRKVFPKAMIEIRGDFFVAIPCLPRTASKQERESCDPDKNKRRRVIEEIREIFPDFFEILPGGKTTIDIAMINKEYGMRHVMEYFRIENPTSVHYFGDAFDGGNDEPVKNITGVHIHEVSSPEDTFLYLETINK